MEADLLDGSGEPAAALAWVERGLALAGEDRGEEALELAWREYAPRPDRHTYTELADRDDACPELAGAAAGKGCPDQDGDGVVDPEDRCPESKGDPTMQGCGDQDGDGVSDADDRCLDAPGAPERNGCPERRVVVAAETKEIRILEDVSVETGESTILTGSLGILDEVAAAMTDNPQILRVRVEGHTDRRGGGRKNKRLSKDRAAAVVAHLVAAGVAADRLVPEVYGHSEQIADNATAEGRARNRRVVFTILETAPDQAPPPAKPAAATDVAAAAPEAEAEIGPPVAKQAEKPPAAEQVEQQQPDVKGDEPPSKKKKRRQRKKRDEK